MGKVAFIAFSDYFAFKDGNILSRKNGKLHWLKPYLTKQGYRMVKLSEGRFQKGIKICRLIAYAFHKNPKRLPEVNHKDGKKLNDRASNLEWSSRSENQKHAFIMGLQKPMRGSIHRLSKLTPNNIRYIRKSGLTQKVLGKKFGVTQSIISRVKNYKTYRDDA